MALIFGADQSGNNNYWASNNLSTSAGVTYDSMLDSPTDVVDSSGNANGNYATISRSNTSVSGAIYTLTDGNLNYSCSASSGNAGRMQTYGTLPLNAGKYYWEVKVTNANCYIGLTDAQASGDNGSGPSKTITIYNTGQSVTNTTGSWTGATFTYSTNDVIGFAYDGTAMTMNVYKNGSLAGAWSSLDSSVTWFPFFGINASASATTMEANFGQRPFAQTVPSGYKTLCTKNLQEYGSTRLPDTYGNFVNTPDLVWLKNRTSGSYGHRWTDTVRGATRQILSHDTGAQTTDANGLQSFLPNGFQLGSGGDYNVASSNFVAWAWNRGKTPGFDIVNYTASGATKSIPHNLGAVPKFIIVKDTTSIENWQVYHASIGNQYNIYLNTTAAIVGPSATYWGSTSPTSSEFTVGSWQTADTHIAYLWAEVPGFSKFGSYTGNGSTDGIFVHLGFKPRWLLIKETGNANSWELFDTARDQINPASQRLFPNDPQAEATTSSLDIVSNGFKFRVGNTGINRSAGNYIYAAFAESPFKYSNAR